MKKVTFILGTHPEAIKHCPLILEMKKVPYFAVDVCVTG
jgi:UDP-N-acetylglucosamine 2-epimerase (non-hydrolysing)